MSSQPRVTARDVALIHRALDDVSEPARRTVMSALAIAQRHRGSTTPSSRRRVAETRRLLTGIRRLEELHRAATTKEEPTRGVTT